MEDRVIIRYEQGWEELQKWITKLKRIVEGLPEPKFTAESYVIPYTTIYHMCTQKPPHDCSEKLYDKYFETFEDYYTLTVMPSLRTAKNDESLLNQLVEKWANHKVMVRWMSRFFNYLDRYYVFRRSLPSLKEVALQCFRDSVFREVGDNARDAVVGLIHKERQGEQIDRELAKKVIDIFVEIGNGKMDAYVHDFEAVMLENTGEYYSRKASSWISEGYSDADYMLKAEECLTKERDRVSHYLHSSSEEKLMDKVQDELFEPLANLFKQKVTAERKNLVQEVEDAAKNQPSGNEADTPEEVLARELNELHNKYTAYVKDCFKDFHHFHKALSEIFGSEAVPGS